MKLRAAFENMLCMQEPGLWVRVLMAPLWLCSLVFQVVVCLRARLYELGLLSSRALPCRVVTVGNITVGGTGKTPTVILLARLLADAGLYTAVLSRGYGGLSRGPLIVSDRHQMLAAERLAGDEPFMLAQTLGGIPVLTARDRFQGGMLACERFNPHVLVLDDGFQHLRLKRDLDIVLINARNPFGCGALLPRGILREPLGALRRARIIVLTKVDPHRNPEELELRIAAINPAAALFRARFKPTGLLHPATGRTFDLETVRGRTAAGLCSIGDPGHFFSMLAALGVSYSRPLVFPDHHRYSANDFRALAARAADADYLITTQKDIAKMSDDMLQLRNLLVLQVTQTIEHWDRFQRLVFECLGLSQHVPA
ncbi:MAG: tetraacyldisaccharide 4'-kinase [Deltaproteobacteria bacterium]|nr:tetraacyldisaccharide 4'-kinase [Deltaproteobacteria bacterium]